MQQFFSVFLGSYASLDKLIEMQYSCSLVMFKNSKPIFLVYYLKIGLKIFPRIPPTKKTRPKGFGIDYRLL